MNKKRRARGILRMSSHPHRANLTAIWKKEKGINDFLVWVHLLISDAEPECRGSLMYFSLKIVSQSGLEGHVKSLEADPLMFS